ncbi:DMT family transporter [Candidatus Gottesmanbacteria bacterium]|nr:DMT family transporter [Candidatus Gottesmanbacteria bacterium]
MNTISKIFLAVALFAVAFLPLTWIRGGEILLGYDNVFPVQAKAFLFDRLFSWSEIQNFGMDQSGIQGSLIIHAIDALPQLLGVPVVLGQRFVLIFWFISIIGAAYVFAIKLEASKLIRVPYFRYFFPLLYTVNFYTLQAWWIAERTKFSLLVATPLILSILLPWLNESFSLRRVILTALAASGILTFFNGGGWMGLSLYGGLLVALGIFYVLNVYILLAQRKYRDISLLHVWFLLFGLFFITFNAYTFLPFLARTVKGYQTFLASAGGVSGVLGWTLYLSENTSFMHLLRLQGIPDWYNNGSYHPYANIYLDRPIFVIGSFLFPLFALIGLKRYGKEFVSLTVYFLFLVVLGLFFTAGSHPPLGFIFEILMQRIPGFVLFRSPIYKFGYVYWFAMSYFIALGLSAIVALLVQNIKKRFNNFASDWFAAGLTVLVMGSILGYHFPFITGDFFRMSAASFSSRVIMPSHVSDFSEWWAHEGAGKRVLLLPKLNDNWLFEQYRWKYLSLYPVLGNFGNTGIVENLDNLSPQENHLIGLLYRSIEKRQYDVMNMVSHLLGIQYMLLRRDFYYDFPDQEAIRPESINEILKENGHVSLIRSFGPWDLWGYSDARSVLQSVAVSEAAFSDVNRAISVGDVLPFSLYLGDESYGLSTHDSGNQVDVYATCLSCVAERERVSVQFPAARVLPDSPLYPLVEWKNSMLRVKKIGEPYLYSLLGEGLKKTTELTVLINRGQSVFLQQVAQAYVAILDELITKFDSAILESQNPYVLSSAVNEYIGAQLSLLSPYLFSTKKEDIQSVQEVLGKLSELREMAMGYYSSKDFGKRKLFSPNISSPGMYTVAIRNQDARPKEIRVDGTVVNSPVYLDEGKHIVEAVYAEPGSHLTAFQSAEIAGNQCFASETTEYDRDSHYRLRFDTLKNLGKRFFFFIDVGDSFSPVVSFQISDVTNETGGFDTVFSSGVFNSLVNVKKLRLAFCAPLLTKELFDETVRNFSFIRLTDPLVRLEKSRTASFTDERPTVSFQKNDPTSYSVTIQQASSPYFLVLNNRFDRGWKVRMAGSTEEVAEDNHVLANGISNAWLIERTGSYQMTVQYVPQQFFYRGIWISILSTISGVCIFIALRKRKPI